MYHSKVQLVLASASPRRSELLRAAGYVFETDPADTDETVRPGEPASDYAMRVARDKARVVSARRPDAVVIAADTIVVVDGAILGKPADRDDAASMLARLSGRLHAVLTAVVVAANGRDACHLEETSVRFARLSPEEIAWYASSGEPLDKAGAYAVQGLASRFVTGIDGSYSNVVGLPVAAVHKLLRDIGFDDIGAAGGCIDRVTDRGYSEGASGEPFNS